MLTKTRDMVGALVLAAAAWLYAVVRDLTRKNERLEVGKSELRPARPGVPSLHFGAAGRKKARTTRFKLRVGLAGLVAFAVGVPGASLGVDLVRDAFGDGSAETAVADLGGVTTSQSAKSMLRFRGNLFQNRPTPTPTPTETEESVAETEAPAETVAPVAPAGSITEIIYAAAAEFGIDPGYLVAVATCESGLDPSAVNPAGYHGLFQFDETTWGAYGYGSIYDPTAQARTAARMLAAGMASRWPNCA